MSTVGIIMAGKKYSKKQIRKIHDGKCFFCELADYDLLDAHRIYEGEKGGTYDWVNTLPCCVLCHRKCHTGKIKILGNHPSSGANWYLHYIDENGEEQWKPHGFLRFNSK